MVRFVTAIFYCHVYIPGETVWHALVMKTTDSDTIEVQASPEVIDIYVNGVRQNLNTVNEFRGQLHNNSYLI